MERETGNSQRGEKERKPGATPAGQEEPRQTPVYDGRELMWLSLLPELCIKVKTLIEYYFPTQQQMHLTKSVMIYQKHNAVNELFLLKVLQTERQS